MTGEDITSLVNALRSSLEPFVKQIVQEEVHGYIQREMREVADSAVHRAIHEAIGERFKTIKVHMSTDPTWNEGL